MDSNLQRVPRSRSSLELRQCRRQSRWTVLAGICPFDAHTGCIGSRNPLCTNYPASASASDMADYMMIGAYVGSRLILYCKFDLSMRVSGSAHRWSWRMNSYKSASTFSKAPIFLLTIVTNLQKELELWEKRDEFLLGRLTDASWHVRACRRPLTRLRLVVKAPKKDRGFASWSTTRGIVQTTSDGVYQKWPPMKRGSTPQKEKKAMAVGLLINFVIPYCRRYAIMPMSLPAKYWIHQGRCLVLYRTAGKLQDAHQDYSPKPWNVLQSSSRSHSSTLRGPPQHSEATRLERWNMYVP